MTGDRGRDRQDRDEGLAKELGQKDEVLPFPPAQGEARFQLADDDDREKNDLSRRDQIEDTGMTGAK